MQTTTNYAAILRGEQRYARFHYRHTLAGTAHELGIPVGWVWFWLHDGRLKFQNWLRAIWVRIDDVRKLAANLKAVYDAFYATREPISDPVTVHKVLTRWPKFPRHMCVSEAPKRPAASVVPFPASKNEAL